MSEQQLTIEEPLKNKIFKESQLSLAAFLGGPFAASYILARNFKIFGEHKKAKITWTISIIFTIFLAFFLTFIPEEILDKIPNILIPSAYTSAYYGVFYSYQKKKNADYINVGGIFQGWGKTILISIIGLVILLFIFLVMSNIYDLYMFFSK